MAQKNELFAPNEMVVWDDSLEHPKDRRALERHKAEFGEGPFPVVTVREVDDPTQSAHPQVVRIYIDQRRRDLDFSGKWFKHAPQ